MPRERPRDTSRFLEVLPRELWPAGIPLPGGLPHPGQRMLQDRQLIRIARNLVDELSDERTVDVATEDTRGADDRLVEVGPSEPRREVLRPADRLRELEVAHTMPKEVRAHRERHIQALVRGCPRREQQIHERLRLLGVILSSLCVSEDLLELIHEHEQVERFSCSPSRAGVLHEIDERPRPSRDARSSSAGARRRSLRRGPAVRSASPSAPNRVPMMR